MRDRNKVKKIIHLKDYIYRTASRFIKRLERARAKVIIEIKMNFEGLMPIILFTKMACLITLIIMTGIRTSRTYTSSSTSSRINRKDIGDIKICIYT